jgi:tRNA nucleotidyltransferase (CCA-adding enzyme)
MTPKFYIVGGYVRDQLLGVKSKDIDFAVEADSYEAMKDAIRARGCDIKLEKPEYATVRAVDPKHGGVDFVLCRKDGYYSDGRRPDSVESGTLIDDLSRRDFTINAMAMEEDGTIIDYFNGQEHLKDGLIMTVGKPEERFNEDSLRILRALRFTITKCFIPHMCVAAALRDVDIVSKLSNVSEERVREELYKMFKFNTWRTLQYLQTFELVKNAIQDHFPNLWLKPTLEKL